MTQHGKNDLLQPLGPMVAISLAFGLIVSLAWFVGIEWSEADGWRFSVATGAILSLYVVAPCSIVAQFLIAGTWGRILETINLPGTELIGYVLAFTVPGVVQGFLWVCLFRLVRRSWEARRA